MDVKEFRIGNFVYRDGREIKIGCMDFYEYDYNLRHIYQPIPLTEEWLLKFGLSKYDSINYRYSYRNGYYQLQHLFISAEDKFEVLIEDCITEQFTPISNVEIKYVHQLQNLYFALTGEEL